MNTEPQTKDSLTATFKWYARILLGALLLCLVVAGLSMLTAKRAEGVVAAAVSVVNTQLSVDTEYPARIPFSTEISLVPDGLGYDSGDIKYPIPDDKLLVIEDISGRCQGSLGQSPEAVLLYITLNGHNTPYYLFPQYSGYGYGEYQWVFAQHTHLYVEPGAHVYAIDNTTVAPGSSDNGYCQMSISGYLVRPPAS
jgi:hypothetical protein